MYCSDSALLTTQVFGHGGIWMELQVELDDEDEKYNIMYLTYEYEGGKGVNDCG